MYPVMTKFLNFAYDEQGFYGNDKVFTLLGEQIEWLTCFLTVNSGHIVLRIIS